MKYVGLGLWIKVEMSFSDILTICDLIRDAQNKSFRIRYLHYKKVVELFAVGRVRWCHAFFIRRILKLADMLSEEKVERDPTEQLMHFVNWAAPRLRMSAKDLLTQYNNKTLQGFCAESLSFHMQKDMAAGLSQHAPVEYHKILESLYDYKRADALLARNKEIAETEENPDTSPIISLGNAFDPGGYHG